MRIYFDMNIYNRVFDDQTQLRIRFETLAIDILFELVEKRHHELCWSFMLEDENRKNPFQYRRTYIQSLSELCHVRIAPDSAILTLAKEIVLHSNAAPKDAIHVACAAYAGCDFFISCDDKLIKAMKRYEMNSLKTANLKMMNPIDFVREEMKIDVIE